jgi:hypothetical protein
MPQIAPVAGIGGERLQIVRVGRITAVVGSLRRVPSPDESTVRRFDGVVRHLFRSVPALLPARFGTCFDTPEELITVLRLRQASLARALRLVRRRAQMTVRVVTGRLKSAPANAHAYVGTGFSGPMTGADYLRRRAAANRDVPGFDPVRRAVMRWVRDERVERRAGIVTIYHLVPRAATSRYRIAVERSAAAAGLRCIVTGPWPPYAFTDW